MVDCDEDNFLESDDSEVTPCLFVWAGWGEGDDLATAEENHSLEQQCGS